MGLFGALALRILNDDAFISSTNSINFVGGTVEVDGVDPSIINVTLSGGAGVDATYIVQTDNETLTSAQVLGDLDTGLLKVTTTSGVLSTAVEGTDYYGPSGTDVAVADGGTGASSATDARTNLGLGSIAVQDADSVTITGGDISGITDLAVADGGTGASTAGDARTNLGLGTISTQDADSVTITGGSISGITDLSLADGGTGASLTDPNADTLMGWDDSGSTVRFFSLGTNIEIDDDTINVTNPAGPARGGFVQKDATTASKIADNTATTTLRTETIPADTLEEIGDMCEWFVEGVGLNNDGTTRAAKFTLTVNGTDYAGGNDNYTTSATEYRWFARVRMFLSAADTVEVSVEFLKTRLGASDTGTQAEWSQFGTQTIDVSSSFALAVKVAHFATATTPASVYATYTKSRVWLHPAAYGISPSSGISGVEVTKNSGALVGSRPSLNFIEGSNITLTVADDSGNDEIDITIAAASATPAVVVKDEGSTVGTRAGINFHEGTDIGLTISDDAGNNEVDVTISYTGVGGGSTTETGLVNVQDYGAVGDGVTDDRAAIQNAINAAGTTDGKSGIFFPQGTYLKGGNDNPLTMHSAFQIPFVDSYDPSTGIITFSKTHLMVTGDNIAFIADTVIPGTTDGAVYFASVQSSTTIKLYDTRANAVADTGTGLVTLSGKTVTSVDTSAETLTITGHGFRKGQRVRFSSSGSLPTGISSGTNYYVSVPTSDTIRVHTSQSNADSGTSPVNLTSSGSGTILCLPTGQCMHHLHYRKGIFIMKGVGSSILMQDPTQTTSVMCRFDNPGGLIVDGMQFWGQQQDYAYNSFKFGNDAFRIRSAKFTRINDCIFKDFGDSALRSYGALSDPLMKNNSFDTVVSNCHFYNCTQTSSTTDDSIHAATQNIKYVNNTFEKLRTGVKFASRKGDAKTILIQGNTWKDCPFIHDSNAPVEIQYFSNVNIIDNLFDGMSQSSHPGWTMVILSNSSASTVLNEFGTINIRGNVIRNCQRGIHLNNATYAGFTNTLKNVNIVDNLFDNIADATSNGVINFISNPFANIRVDGNIFRDIGNQYCIKYTAGPEAGFIINGNIIDNMTHTTPRAIGFTPANTGAYTDVTITNNILGDTPNVGVYMSNTDGIVLSNNQYAKSSGIFYQSPGGTGFPYCNKLIATGNRLEATTGFACGTCSHIVIHGNLFDGGTLNSGTISGSLITDNYEF